MMTLREFITKVNFYEHYRIYAPNRDCLIYESYFKVHSPYYFDKEHETSLELNKQFYQDNDYCDSVRKSKELDEETKLMLERYGDYLVFSMECSSCCPRRIYTDANDCLHFEQKEDPSQPGCATLGCFNLFIIAPKGE